MKNVEADSKKSNVISAEMEASTIFTLASLLRLRTGVCSIVDLVLAGNGQQPGHEVSVEETFEPKPVFILRSCRCAVEVVKILSQWDRDNQAKGRMNWSPSLSYVSRI